MQKFYAERDTSGPEFDDALIRLVRVNPAIYDVNHPHYRRNPVRIAIWDRIAKEMEAPSKFLQTKWKNIRYNYLQEMKVLETGHPNANIRRRRFTEDLSFLQNTAQSYNVKKGQTKNSSYNSSDNESNSFMCADPASDAYEIIELDQSDEEGDQMVTKQQKSAEKQTTPVENSSTKNNANQVSTQKFDTNIVKNFVNDYHPDVTIEHKIQSRQSTNLTNFSTHQRQTSPTCYSNSSSPLLTPMVVMGNGKDHETNGISNEVTIEPISKSNANKRPLNHIESYDSKRSVDSFANSFSLSNSFPEVVTSNDTVELYCLSLVDTLKSMPRSERERVKFEFAKILKDAKYKDQS